MRKVMIFLAVCLLVMSVSLVQANPIYKVSAQIGPDGGGPFTITPITPPGGSFNTFCLETGETIHVGDNYWGTIDGKVMYSSTAFPGTPATLTDPAMRLESYYLDNEVPLALDSNPTVLGQIQVAIWAYQGQIGAPSGNTYYDNAPSYSLTHPYLTVLNLWNKDNSTAWADRAQSFMIDNPVPEPATMLLLGSGLIGLAGFARRKFRK